MRLSSKAIAGDGIQHRAGEKAQADDYEQKVEHGYLTFRVIAALNYAPAHKDSRRKDRCKNKNFIRSNKNRNFIQLWRPVESQSAYFGRPESAAMRGFYWDIPPGNKSDTAKTSNATTARATEISKKTRCAEFSGFIGMGCSRA
jgi:hypothetical protein